MKPCSKRLIAWLNTRHALRDALEEISKECGPDDQLYYDLSIKYPRKRDLRPTTKRSSKAAVTKKETIRK